MYFMEYIIFQGIKYFSDHTVLRIKYIGILYENQLLETLITGKFTGYILCTKENKIKKD